MIFAFQHLLTTEVIYFAPFQSHRQLALYYQSCCRRDSQVSSIARQLGTGLLSCKKNQATAENKCQTWRDYWVSATRKIEPQLEAKRKAWHDNLKASSKLQNTIVKGKAAEEHECQELHHD